MDNPITQEPITQESIKPDSDIEWKNNNNSVDYYAALIVAKYMEDKESTKLVWTCKKYRELFDQRFFNYDDLTQETVAYYNIDTLNKVYIYNNPKIALDLYNKNKIKCLINYKPEAFEKEGFKLPSNTVNIPAYRFYYSNFIYNNPFYIPSQITSIDTYAFAWTKNLKHIYFSDSKVKSIDFKAFSHCSDLESIVIPSSVTHVGDWCFNRCIKLTGVHLYCPIVDLPHHIFTNCFSLKSIVLPNSITKLTAGCFERCLSLRNINLPPQLKVIGEICFNHCSRLENINLPTTLTKIEYSAFGECRALQKIDIPTGITEIPRLCFVGCSSLRTVNLPPTLRIIREYAFFGCHQLQLVIPNSRVILEKDVVVRSDQLVIQN